MAAVAGKKLELIKCPKCEFSSKRLTTFEVHVKQVHNTTIQSLWDELNDGPKKCLCGCNKVTTFSGWKYGYAKVIIGHNANLVAVYGEERAREISEKRATKLRGRTGWAKGLTKENDERVKQRAAMTSTGRKLAFQLGKIKTWNKGQTKSSNEKIARLAEKQREKFATGELVSWHKGLTEHDDHRLKLKNDQLRQAYANNQIVPWSKGLTKEDDPRIGKTWKNRNPAAEYAHIRWSDEDIRNMLKNNQWLRLMSIENYKNDRTPGLFVRCSMCDNVEKVSLLFAKNDRCEKCCPTGSNAQFEMSAWIESLGIKIAKNVKGIIGRQELDIYVPAHKIAVEYNGLYWHNEAAGKLIDYHQSKSDKCNDVGISLFHVFEDEWRDKRLIIESMIKHRLGLTSKKVDARKCNIRLLQVAERKEFFSSNHIDGDTNSKVAFGLIYNDQIVSALSLRVPFHKKHNASLEVARMCNVKDTNVRGGLSRLTKFAAIWTKGAGYDSMMTYVDTRFGKAQSWESSGWKFVGFTTPRFWWTDNVARFNRFQFKADKSRNMSEEQVAVEAGVVKIYGCKNASYKYDC